jgi:hypothetical protein
MVLDLEAIHQNLKCIKETQVYKQPSINYLKQTTNNQQSSFIMQNKSTNKTTLYFSTQQKCFDVVRSQSIETALFFARDNSLSDTKGAKMYFFFENIKQAQDHFDKIGNQGAYELIREDRPARIAFDIDGTFDRFGKSNVLKELNNKLILNTIIDFITEKLSLFNPEIVVDTSNSDIKFSYHIRVLNVLVTRFADLK